MTAEGAYSTCDNPACYGHEMRGHVLGCDRCGNTRVLFHNRVARKPVWSVPADGVA